eukprot:m.259932 g.259932  ORF g.259932 m.259932 type:complete len:215 (+) comp15981_c0_seq2:171-815(+)
MSTSTTQYAHGNGPKHWWKSGWATKKGKMGIKSQQRWLQLRHYVIFYYDEEKKGYNSWGRPENEIEEPDDEMKDTSLLDKLPGLPEIQFPSLPNLPSLPDMPDMPDMPSLKMPDMPDMPSLKAPSMADLKKMKMPSMPKRKERHPGGPYGRIQMHGAQVRQDGKTVKLTNCRHTKIYKDSTEQEDNASFTFTFDNEDEAYSWLVSMAYGGATRD